MTPDLGMGKAIRIDAALYHRQVDEVRERERERERASDFPSNPKSCIRKSCHIEHEQSLTRRGWSSVPKEQEMSYLYRFSGAGEKFYSIDLVWPILCVTETVNLHFSYKE